MKKYIIDRSIWRCGGSTDLGPYLAENIVGQGRTKLLNIDGFMCCLGQTCRQDGATDQQLLNNDYPRQINAIIGPFTKPDNREPNSVFFLGFVNTGLSNDAMSINDDNYINLEERERRLKELFESHGFELEFVN